MKDLTKYYIDLSKLSEEQIKALPQMLENAGYKVLPETLSDLISGEITDGFKFLFYSPSGWNQNDYPLNCKTELTYPEFIKLFEGGEVPDPTAQLKADKEDLLEALETILYNSDVPNEIYDQTKSLIQKHKPCEIK